MVCYVSASKILEQLFNEPRRGTLDHHLIKKKVTCCKPHDCEQMPATAATIEEFMYIDNNYLPETPLSFL